jgi:hypothetical protein
MPMTLLFALLTTLLAQARENPVYSYWTGCRPGSWVSFKGESGAAGARQLVETTHTLVSLTPEKAVVEESAKVNGVAGKSVKREIPAQEDKPDTIEREGEETITVGREKLACRWMILQQKDKKDGARAKLWLTREIPGGIARVELTLAGQDGPSSTLTASDWLKR